MSTYRTELLNIKDKTITTVVVDPQNYMRTVQDLLAEVLQMNRNCVFVSTTLTPEEVRKIAAKHKDGKNLHLIDVTSEILGNGKYDVEEMERVAMVYPIGNPSHLDDILHEIKKVSKEAGKGSILILDSLTTLLIYNEEKRVMQFAYKLGIFLKSQKMPAALFAVKQDLAEDLIRSLSTISEIKERRVY